MIIEFSQGKIIANQHEIVVRLSQIANVSMQCQTEALQLIGRGANVITAYDMQCQWSIKLDSEQQLQQLADFLCLPIQ
ncbi:DUF3389 family protein [Vibrio rumoiensis]|uniref:DUF3389 family protein n=1 Tax=Vibrio rumoiensis TaxID=76258 RepID=A0ABW7IUB2_9VIBR